MGQSLSRLHFCKAQKNVERTAEEFQVKHLNLRIKGPLSIWLCLFIIVLSVCLSRSTLSWTSLQSATMKYAMTQGSLLKAVFSLATLHVTALGKAVPRTASCHNSHYPGPSNPSFENGLNGWTVVSGNAFGPASVSSESSYWGGPFNKVGNNFLWGFSQSGDPAVGQIRSSTFKASSVMSFLVGGGLDAVNLYVGLVRESDGKLLFSQTGMNDEAMIRVICKYMVCLMNFEFLT